MRTATTYLQFYTFLSITNHYGRNHRDSLRYLRVTTTSGVYLRPSEVQQGLDLSNTVFIQAWTNASTQLNRLRG